MASPMQRRKLMGEINVVPYIDVMLVLLIIFMVTAPLLTQGIEVELPKSGAEPIEASSDLPPFVLSINAGGEFFLNVGDNEDEALGSQEIVAQTRRVLSASPETSVLVKADRSVPYGIVVGGMVMLQQGGAENVGFVTDPLDSYPVPEVETE